LVWRNEGWHVPRPVVDLLGPHLAGLAPSGAGSQPPPRAAGDAHLDAAFAGLDVAERAVLDRLTWGPPVGRLPATGAAAQAGRRLVTAGLLVATGDSGAQVLLPRDVALRLRGGHLYRRFAVTPAEPSGRAVPPAQVAIAAGGQAVHLMTLIEEVLTRWGDNPPRVLRGGGVAVRDLRAVATALDVPSDEAAFVVELIRDAGLLADNGANDPAWTPTPDYDEWIDLPTSRRWLVLARAWLASIRAPHRVGTRIEGATSPINALSEAAAWPRLRVLRREILSELAQLPPDLSPTLESLVDRLDWRHPLRPEGMMHEAVTATVAAAEWLGVTGRGVLSPAGHALLAGTREAIGDDEASLAAVASQLPEPVDHALLQADLTAVVPGPPGPRLGGLLRVAAEQESRGGASVYRFTPQSVRRALDTGWTAEDLLARLTEASSTPLPQPLAYLVTDVARRHGMVRVGAIASFVRSDDIATLDALAARRECAPLQLRRLAPTVLVSPAPTATLLQILRETGVAPVLEGADGAVVITQSEPARARRRSAPVVTLSELDDEQARCLVASLRKGQAARDDADVLRDDGDGPRVPPGDPTMVMALVREAISRQGSLWIGLADADGMTQRLLLTPARIDGGRIHGDVQGRTGTQVLSLHRITGAVPAT
ncbi:MAG: helicase-associated domain-containing protein, partial [Micrococcales bacterium]|nr:helicase-associated domain-containing protein [Micrococcales bacterium]